MPLDLLGGHVGDLAADHGGVGGADVGAFDESEVAIAIASAINGSNLDEVTATLGANGQAGQVAIEGADRI